VRPAGSGYRGLAGGYELLVGDEHVRRAIQKSAPGEDIRDAAVAGGMRLLTRDETMKNLQGHTDITQVKAVCGTGLCPTGTAQTGPSPL
jgi:type II secretory ATPase GspE/PulE/Tfp pilus assembly ATPase PilB-like protein